MKLRVLLTVSALLMLSACGEQKSLLTEPVIQELDIDYPRTFNSSVQYRDLSGVVLEQSVYQPTNSAAVFGCLLNANGFTMVMRNGPSDRLRIRFPGLDVRQTREEYRPTDLARVTLDGRSPQGTFDFNSSAPGSPLQVESCEMRVQMVGRHLAGQLTCQNATSSVDSSKQAELVVNFNCDAVQ
ncbi:MAG: hypothetical protein KF799_07100 [Bdellovibrionales bacterium]|nr:hypothetical protein [Bdellovibrionales bacterium]